MKAWDFHFNCFKHKNQYKEQLAGRHFHCRVDIFIAFFTDASVKCGILILF